MGGVGPSWAPALTHSLCHSGPAAGPAIPTSNSYSKKTQSNNAENKRPEEDRESGRKASSTAKVPASPLPGLERKKTTPTPSTVSQVRPPPPPRLLQRGLPVLSRQFFSYPRPLPLAAHLAFPARPLMLPVESLAPRSKSEVRPFPTPSPPGRWRGQVL